MQKSRILNSPHSPCLDHIKVMHIVGVQNGSNRNLSLKHLIMVPPTVPPPPRHDTKQTMGKVMQLYRPLGLVMAKKLMGQIFLGSMRIFQCSKKTCPKLHKNAQWNDNFFSEHLKSGKLFYNFYPKKIFKKNKSRKFWPFLEDSPYFIHQSILIHDLLPAFRASI